MERSIAEPECPAFFEIPRNQWYVAAFSHEVGRTVLQRRLAGDSVVMFRTEGGQVVALADRCAHRGLPLSKGRLVGDAIQCAYHGHEYGVGGRCVKIPSQSAIPAAMAVHAYPVEERWQWVWIWMGDPAKADPSLIPDHGKLGLGAPGWHASPIAVIPMNGNFGLLHENLIDVTHISYLHAGAFDAGDTASIQPSVEYGDNTVKTTREFDEVPTENSARVFNLRVGRKYRRSLITQAFAPNYCTITNIFKDVESDDAPNIQIVNIGVTPGGPRLCYQIFSIATNYPFEWDEHGIKYLSYVVGQDADALQGVQEVFDQTGPSGLEVSVRSDQPALRFRRMMVDMARQERAVS